MNLPNWRSPEYKTWIGMKGRCLNKNHADYSYYGGDGVTVCERWMIFKNFFEDMGIRPSDLHTLDRINNEEGYSPDNCRWATRKVQAQNRRNVTMMTFMGKTMTAIEWARALRMDKKKIYRLAKANIPAEEIFKGRSIFIS